jgi:cell division protein FtsB
MRKKNDKVTLRERFEAKLSYILIILLLFVAMSVVRSFMKVGSVDERLAQGRNKVEDLKSEHKELEMKLEEIESMEYVEKQLRDSLGLAHKGEIVVILPEAEVLRKLAPKVEVEEDVLPQPNWQKWIRLFL